MTRSGSLFKTVILLYNMWEVRQKKRVNTDAGFIEEKAVWQIDDE